MPQSNELIKQNFEYNNEALYKRLSTYTFKALLLNGIWRTIKSNGEPEYVLVEDMAPNHITHSIKKAKADNNSLIIDILSNEVDRRNKKGELAISKLNNNTTNQQTMNTNKNSSAVAKQSDVLDSNQVENTQNSFRYNMNQVVRLKGRDDKVRDVIITFRQEAIVENGYRAAYKYKVKGSNGDNSALYSQRDMIDMENRAIKKPRDVSQKFEVNNTYGRYTIVNHDIIFRCGKRKDGSTTFSNSVTGHRYDVTVDGGKTVVTFTQTKLVKAIKRESKRTDANAVIQSELNFNSSESSQLRAENAELKKMIAEIHEKLNMRAATIA